MISIIETVLAEHCDCTVILGGDFNPHQYTLRNLSIRTPGVHVDPNGISSFMVQVHGMLSQKWFLITSARMYCDQLCLLVGWFVGE